MKLYEKILTFKLGERQRVLFNKLMYLLNETQADIMKLALECV